MTITSSDQDRTDEINEALSDAITDGDERPRRDALEHHLGLRGLRIVGADDLTVADLQIRCGALAKRIGPNASVWTMTRTDGDPSLTIYTNAKHLAGFQTFSAKEGWEAAFVAADGWLSKRDVPRAWLDDPAFQAAE